MTVLCGLQAFPTIEVSLRVMAEGVAAEGLTCPPCGVLSLGLLPYSPCSILLLFEEVSLLLLLLLLRHGAWVEILAS